MEEQNKKYRRKVVYNEMEWYIESSYSKVGELRYRLELMEDENILVDVPANETVAVK